MNTLRSFESNPSSIELIPTLGGFATSMIIYWQGECYKGYFTDFKVDESADKPGWFEYGFNFTIIKRTGMRKNSMAWHRNPYDSAGVPVTASVPKEGPRLDELSFKTQQVIVQGELNELDPGFSKYNSITSKFTTLQNSQNDENNVGINRQNSTKGK